MILFSGNRTTFTMGSRTSSAIWVMGNRPHYPIRFGALILWENTIWELKNNSLHIPASPAELQKENVLKDRSSYNHSLSDLYILLLINKDVTGIEVSQEAQSGTAFIKPVKYTY